MSQASGYPFCIMALITITKGQVTNLTNRQSFTVQISWLVNKPVPYQKRPQATYVNRFFNGTYFSGDDHSIPENGYTYCR